MTWARMVLWVPLRVVSLNRKPRRLSVSWALARERRHAAHVCAHTEMVLRRLAIAPDEPKRITFRAFVGHLMDKDNLVGGIKPYLDGLRDAHAIHDDGPMSGHLFEFDSIEQVVTDAGGRRGLEITIEPRESPRAVGEEVATATSGRAIYL